MLNKIMIKCEELGRIHKIKVMQSVLLRLDELITWSWKQSMAKMFQCLTIV